MANMDVGKCRIYPDLINFLLNRGISQNGEFDVMTTSTGNLLMGTFTTGSEAELFDMKPLNLCTFDTSADTDAHVLITIDTQNASTKKDFIAILNHNLATSVGKIRIFAGDALSDVQGVDGKDTEELDWSGITVTEIVNADTITTGAASNSEASADNLSKIITPAADGTTIFTFPEQTMRYWGIQFEGATSGTGAAGNKLWGSTDFSVGNIMIGEYYNFPVAPNQNIKRSIDFSDFNKVSQSVGGQRYGLQSSPGRIASSTTISPFGTNVSQHKTHGGRLIYDMQFSYLASTDLMPNEYNAIQTADDAVVADVWNITSGNLTPFLFTIDKESTGDKAESEMIFARFANDSLDMTQVAHKFWTINLKIEEEF